MGSLRRALRRAHRNGVAREPKRPWSVRSTTMPKAATAMAAFAKELAAEVIRPRTH
jgi:hypothetical protein